MVATTGLRRSHQAVQTFSAIGTYVQLATGDPTDLDEAGTVARQVIAAVDETCSRFRPDSDLSRVNARGGQWVRVDPLLCAAVRVGLEAARETDGLVDPCLGARLVDLGYDADLALVLTRPERPWPMRAPRPHLVGAWREIEVSDDAVRVPVGVALDLGATAKAWAADLVASTVVDRIGGAVVVSLGGDVAALTDDRVPSWPVTLSERPEENDGPTVWITEGGLATSSTVVRRWSRDGVDRHHLLDPRTGDPVQGPWRTVTATGPTSVAANVATTTALVLGEDAPTWLEERGVDARLVGLDSRVRRTGRWPVETEEA